MRDAERWWVVAAGSVGLLCWVVGSLLARVPAVERPVAESVEDIRRRRPAVLAGSVLSVIGTTLLMWPITAVATEPSPERWASLAALSIVVSGVGFAVLATATVAVAALAWRAPGEVHLGAARIVLDAAHLATWSITAPIGAASVVATTVVAVQVDIGGVALVLLAAVKVLTVGIELAGTGRRSGWNAGGWAAGSSGYATVAWFATLLLSLA